MEKLKVLGTSGLNYYLENLLQDAKEKIILITPYIKLDYRIKEILKKQKENGIEIIIVSRDNENIKLIQEYSTKIYIRKNLHAKCYLTEKEAILTSLNLYDFSQRNNDEMGIYINKESHI